MHRVPAVSTMSSTVEERWEGEEKRKGREIVLDVYVVESLRQREKEKEGEVIYTARNGEEVITRVKETK